MSEEKEISTNCNIIYLRISKVDKDLASQERAIKDKFKIANPLILKDKGTAYDMEKMSKRESFLALLDMIFDASNTTIKDLFLDSIQRKEVNLYVWDYHRIIRNFEFNLLFGLLSDKFTIKIHSYKQGSIKKTENETPLEKFSRYIFYGINAFDSENYSYNISTNTKKAFMKDKGVSFSYKGNKSGRRFTNSNGEKIILGKQKVLQLREAIRQSINELEQKGYVGYNNIIIEKMQEKFNVKISKAFISKMKNDN